MGIMTAVSVIFNTGYTYSFSSIKAYFLDIEENIFPIKLKVIAKVLEIPGFGTVEYSSRNEIGHIIALGYWSYYISRLKIICASFPHKASAYQKDTRVTS